MKSETLRVRNVVDATRLGAWLRPGEGMMACGWHYAKLSLSNARRLSFSGMCIWLFLFLSLCRFGLLFFCSHWSLVPRSTGHIMVTTRYSDKHGSKSRQKNYVSLQAMAPTNIKTVHQTSLLHIESSLDRLGLLSPTHDQRS